MAKVAVRRVNEWDGPAMLKIYAPYTGTCAAPEAALPPLPEYVQRIDRYTYGLGWLLCEIDCQPAGFCHLREDPFVPEDPWSVEFQVYVKEGQHRQGVGKALWTLMRDMLEMGSRRRVVVRVDRENREALGFFAAMGFESLADAPQEEGAVWLSYRLKPWDPQARRPVKPYLVEAADYEAAREHAAGMVRGAGGPASSAPNSLS